MGAWSKDTRAALGLGFGGGEQEDPTRQKTSRQRALGLVWGVLRASRVKLRMQKLPNRLSLKTAGRLKLRQSI